MIATSRSPSIFVDEIGIEIGVFGELRLKTSYWPVFERRDGFLAPVAVEGLAVVKRHGRPVAVEPTSTTNVALPLLALSRTLHLRNMRNIGVDGLDLLLRADASASRSVDASEPARLASSLEELGIDPRHLVCEVGVDSVETDELAAAARLRALGMRISIGDFVSGPWDMGAVQRLRPDLVRLDAAWLDAVGGRPEAAKLLPSLVAGLHAQGTRALAEGIDAPARLRAALDAGADWFQGTLLAVPALAGAIFPDRPIPIDALLSHRRGRITPLFG